MAVATKENTVLSGANTAKVSNLDGMTLGDVLHAAKEQMTVPEKPSGVFVDGKPVKGNPTIQPEQVVEVRGPAGQNG